MSEYATTMARGSVAYEQNGERHHAELPDPVEPETARDEEMAQAFGESRGQDWELVSSSAAMDGRFHFYLFWTWRRG